MTILPASEIIKAVLRSTENQLYNLSQRSDVDKAGSDLCEEFRQRVKELTEEVPHD